MQTSTVSQITHSTSNILPSDNTSNGIQQLNNQASSISLNNLKLLKPMTNLSSNKRSIKEAKDLGKQVEYNLRLNGYDKHEAKVIGGLVKFLKEKISTTQNKTSVDAPQTQDNTDALKGKKHSKIGFYFKKFINLFNRVPAKVRGRKVCYSA